MAANCVGDVETTSRVSLLQTPPSFGKRLERNQDINEGEPLELKAKVNGSPKPIVISSDLLFLHFGILISSIYRLPGSKTENQYHLMTATLRLRYYQMVR